VDVVSGGEDATTKKTTGGGAAARKATQQQPSVLGEGARSTTTNVNVTGAGWITHVG